MGHNSNIPYETYQNGKYISIASTSSPHSLVTPLILSEQYRSFEERFKKLSVDTRSALSAVSTYVPSKFSAEVDTPFARMSEARKAAIIADLKQAGIGFVNEKKNVFGLDDDSKRIVNDIRAGKPGYNTPVYNVRGLPVVAEKFDAGGNLDKTVASIYGVPSGRDAAILSNALGIRKELRGTVKPPVATPPKTAGMRP